MGHVLKNFERSKFQFRCLLCFSQDYFFTFSFESTDLVSILSLCYFRFASFLFTFPFFCVYSQTRSLWTKWNKSCSRIQVYIMHSICCFKQLNLKTGNHPQKSIFSGRGERGRFRFDQIFGNFRFEIEWNGKNSGKSFRKFRNTFWVQLFWWNFRNYRKFCVPSARDIGFSLPTELELTWTLENAIMAGDRTIRFPASCLPHCKRTAVFVFLAKLRAAQMNCQLESAQCALFLEPITDTFP